MIPSRWQPFSLRTRLLFMLLGLVAAVVVKKYDISFATCFPSSGVEEAYYETEPR